MAQKYYAGSGSITFRTVSSDPNSGVLVDPTSITLEVRQCADTPYRFWENGSSVQPASPMSSSATGEYYYVWSLASVSPGSYVAQVAATRGGQVSVERLAVEVL